VKAILELKRSVEAKYFYGKSIIHPNVCQMVCWQITQMLGVLREREAADLASASHPKVIVGGSVGGGDPPPVGNLPTELPVPRPDLGRPGPAHPQAPCAQLCEQRNGRSGSGLRWAPPPPVRTLPTPSQRIARLCAEDVD
jgi:hypothetical protein